MNLRRPLGSFARLGMTERESLEFSVHAFCTGLTSTPDFHPTPPNSHRHRLLLLKSGITKFKFPAAGTFPSENPHHLSSVKYFSENISALIFSRFENFPVKKIFIHIA
jgi:hypothetical protein